jgi:hypothetical protein
MNLSGRAWLLLFLILIIGCGPDQSLLMKTKLGAPLRQRMTALQEKESPEKLSILGKCVSPIDGRIREDFMEAWAQVHTMTHDLFGATILSDRVLDVAALDFVVQLQLSQTSKPLSQ